MQSSLEIFRYKFNVVVHDVKIEVKRQQELYTKPEGGVESLENWVKYMEKHVEAAKAAVLAGDDRKALEEIKVLAGVNYNCLMAQVDVPEGDLSGY